MRSHPPPPDRSQFAPALTLRRQENGGLRARRKCHGAQGSIDASCVIANDPIHCVELARRVASGFHVILKCPVRLPVIVIRPEGGVARSIEYLEGDHDPVAAQSVGARPRIAPVLIGSWCTRYMRRWRLASAGGGAATVCQGSGGHWPVVTVAREPTRLSSIAGRSLRPAGHCYCRHRGRLRTVHAARDGRRGEPLPTRRWPPQRCVPPQPG